MRALRQSTKTQIDSDNTILGNITNSKNIAAGRGSSVNEFTGKRQGQTYIEQQESFPKQRGCYVDLRNMTFAVVAGAAILTILVFMNVVESTTQTLSAIREYIEELMEAPEIPPEPPPPDVPSFPTLDDAVDTFTDPNLVLVLPVAYSYESGPYTDGQFTPSGFEIELLNEAEKRWFRSQPDSKIEYHPIRVAERIKCAEERCAAFVVGAVSETPERCFDIGIMCTEIPHKSDVQALIVRNDLNIDEFHIDEVLALADGVLDEEEFCVFFADKKIGIIIETTGERLIQNCADRPELVDKLDGQEFILRKTVIDQVKDGGIHGYVTNKLIADFYTKDEPELRVIPLDTGIELTVFILNESMGLDVGLKELIEYTMNEMVCDGTYEEIYKNPEFEHASYFGPEMLNKPECNVEKRDSASPELRSLIEKP